MAFSPLRMRRRAIACIGAALLPSAVLATTPAFAQPATDAKASLAEANKAVRAKDWATAIRAFDTANRAQPSSEALEGLAKAREQAGAFGEAHAAYAEWLERYGAKAPAPKKKQVEARLKELADKTGTLTITVDEAGAQIVVDDKPIGVSPLASPLRLTAGPHHVRVTKEGFVPFDRTPHVGGGATATVEVKLVAASSKGKLVVKEKNGKAVRVLLDGVDMGDAPWSGEVEAGQHEVGLRATGLTAIPQKLTVERGKTQEVELVASSSSAPLKIGTSDAKGLIYIDGKLVGEGSFIGEVPAGTHKLKITREGYDPFEEDIVVK
ncbi:MAG TPA: PEGA domain-containing protein, partial [Labilithrix sp.]|nr:PEGA domain-containing protein [Labilithrix sp.]